MSVPVLDPINTASWYAQALLSQTTMHWLCVFYHAVRVLELVDRFVTMSSFFRIEACVS